MNLRRRIAIACMWAVAAGCTGAVSWQSACGCVPTSVGLAEDLALDPNTQFTPIVLAEAVERRFSSLGVPVDLERLRSLGPAFKESCYKRPELRLRCTFSCDRQGNLVFFFNFSLRLAHERDDAADEEEADDDQDGGEAVMATARPSWRAGCRPRAGRARTA